MCVFCLPELENAVHRWLGCLLVLAACAPEADPGPAPTDMVFVPGATYEMGTDSSEVAGLMDRYPASNRQTFDPELGRRPVDVAGFYLDATEVTNGLFAEFVEENPAWSRSGADSTLHNGRYLEHWGADGPAIEDLDRPVTFVTWYAAVAYCEWRGKRLPSEAEWELAAGGGDRSNEFPWGQAPPSEDLVSWSGGDHAGPMPVGSYPPTGPGLYDMSGNVWKFLADAWPGAYGQVDAPADPVDTISVRRVVRGGSYEANVLNLRVRYRDSHRPFDAREMVGFRCARSAGP